MFLHRHSRRNSFALAAALLFSALAHAQVDLTGDWAVRIHEDQAWRGPGAEIGEYEGLPLSPAGRMKALSWNASSVTMPERQCNPLPADDFTDISGMRIWKEVDPVSQKVIAWHEYTEWQAQERMIWMDDRPHPSPYAPHTWQGFSTGKWEGNQLAINTTHLKTAMYERHGLFRSDVGGLFERWIRHGNYMTVMLIITDPVYLSEPFIRTRNYELSLSQQLSGYSCVPAAEIANRPVGYVPHYLPGKNPFVLNGNVRYKVPEVALPGGPETMYPEFLAKMKDPAAKVSMPFPATKPMAIAVPPQSETDITVLPVQGSVYLLAGEGANITVHVGESSITVVDTESSRMTGKILEAIRKISPKPIRFVINTTFDTDHTGGNAEISKAGESVGGSNIDRDLGAAAVSSAEVIAHENVLNRLSAPTGGKPLLPSAAWPTETYATPKYELFDGEAIQIIHIPSAHTDGDSIVFFRRSDVISTGDIFSTETYPVIDLANGGSIAGEIAALNRLIDLTVPRDKQEGGTYVIPGHGRVADEADLVEYRDMVTILRDRIADLIRQGKSLAEVKAAQPTADYDPRYSLASNPWNKDKFIEAVYAGLSQAKAK